MGDFQWLSKVAKYHNDWIRIVQGFGEFDYAEDIVQETYIVLTKYANEEKLFNNGKLSKGYVYFTLRSVLYQYHNTKKRIQKISIDDADTAIQIPHNSQMDEQVAFYKVCQLIDDHLEGLHWYDKKLFKIYRDTDLSIRQLAKETHISWVSIFNTLKNVKRGIKEELTEDYQDYKNEDYERITT